MRGKYLPITLATMGGAALACAASQYNAPDPSQSYREQYQEQYDTASEQTTPAPKPVSTPIVAREKQLTIEEMLAVKQKIENADAYTSRNLPGNAYVQLREAQNIAGTAFREELGSRLNTTTAALRNYINTYKMNIRVRDQTQSGREEYLWQALLDQEYKPGIEAVSSYGAYTLTIDVRTIEIDEKTKTQRFTILIPTGIMKTMNGEYAALQQRVNVECADYFARRDAARGAGIQGIGGFAQAINTANASNGTDILGIALGIAKTIDASERVSAKDTASYNCQQAQEKLQATSMFTSDTLTAPFSYTEEVNRKTATAGVRVVLTTNKGTTLFSSPLLDLEFVREDLYRDEVLSNNIPGDPKETVSDKEVIRGVLQTIPEQVYKLTNEGAGLWDVIALGNAQILSGERALEAYVQLYFDAYQESTRRIARNYIVVNTNVRLE